MAVYKRTYKGYGGVRTATWSRFLILPRYSYAMLFQSRFLVMYLMGCFFFPLGCAAFIYLSHNLSFLETLNIPLGRVLEVNGTFFNFYCSFQGAMAYLLTAFVGPSLVSPDLANNALPLYFCRPLNRFEYVAGKASILLFLLSLITWVPALILFGIQASLAGWEWTTKNLWMAGALFVGLLVWDVVLALIALAMSAWVKWKIAAGALILGIFFAGAGFGSAINAIVRTKNGALLDLVQDIGAIWSKLFRLEEAPPVDVYNAWIALGIACAVCLWLLSRRVRAFEVVK